MIGAVAVSAHGEPRGSLDADAILSLRGRDLAPRDVARLFEAEGLRALVRTGGENDPIPAVVKVEDGDGNEADLLLGLRGLDPAAFDRAAIVAFEGSSLPVASPEDLVAMKCFAGSARDLEDAASVWRVSRERIDLPLLRALADRFGPASRAALERILAASD